MSTEVAGIVLQWAHGRARVRLVDAGNLDGRELVVRPAARIRGHLREGERVTVALDSYGSGRIVAREDARPEMVRASERRRRKAEAT